MFCATCTKIKVASAPILTRFEHHCSLHIGLTTYKAQQSEERHWLRISRPQSINSQADSAHANTMAVAATTSHAEGIQKVNIGTRKSQLAIAQVESIIEQLKAVAPEPDYMSNVVSTMADENQVKSFSAFDSKSIWTEELEQLLTDGKLDVVVHCLKGMLAWEFYSDGSLKGGIC